LRATHRQFAQTHIEMPGSSALPRHDKIAGIDGLRALAALAVFMLHTGHGLAKGGGIGVDIFFVISGFVITRSLLREYSAHGSINIPAFYLRRVVRLWPALIVLALTIWLIYPTQTTLTKEVLPSIFYYTNWAIYFGYGPFIIGHTWTLAVEEQFYLVWPFALILGIRVLKSEKAAIVILMLALAPVIWRIVMIAQGAPLSDPRLAFFGGRTEGLYFGAALAFLRPDQVKQLARPFRLAALYLIVCFHFSHPSQVWFSLGGSFLVQVSTTIVIAQLVTYPESRAVKWLEWPPLRRLGQISYGFYLWHFPILEFFLIGTPVKSVASFALTLACATLSWHLVEVPAKRLLPRWASASAARDLKEEPAEETTQLSLSPPSTGT
jgi:peptidoglycan/LPS O-acetylase OafA/YrhL